MTTEQRRITEELGHRLLSRLGIGTTWTVNDTVNVYTEDNFWVAFNQGYFWKLDINEQYLVVVENILLHYRTNGSVKMAKPHNYPHIYKFRDKEIKEELYELFIKSITKHATQGFADYYLQLLEEQVKKRHA